MGESEDHDMLSVKVNSGMVSGLGKKNRGVKRERKGRQRLTYDLQGVTFWEIVIRGRTSALV